MVDVCGPRHHFELSDAPVYLFSADESRLMPLDPLLADQPAGGLIYRSGQEFATACSTTTTATP